MKTEILRINIVFHIQSSSTTMLLQSRSLFRKIYIIFFGVCSLTFAQKWISNNVMFLFYSNNSYLWFNFLRCVCFPSRTSGVPVVLNSTGRHRQMNGDDNNKQETHWHRAFLQPHSHYSRSSDLTAAITSWHHILLLWKETAGCSEEAERTVDLVALQVRRQRHGIKQKTKPSWLHRY